MQVILVRSTNSAVAGNPILGVFTDSTAADNAVIVFKDAEKAHLKERWKGNWKHFVSDFYVESLTSDIPAEELATEKYKN